MQVTDNEGKSSTYTDTVDVHLDNLKPTASIGSSNFTAGQSGSLFLSVDDPDGQITALDFDWGDGTAHSTNPQNTFLFHTYQNPGDFTQVLAVTDDSGATTTVRRTVHVAPASPTAGNHAPQPEIYSSQTTAVGKRDYLSASPLDPDSGDFNFTYAWSGDADTHFYATADAVTETTDFSFGYVEFDTPGVHDVTVVVTDEHGAAGTQTMSITATTGDQKPSLSLDGPSSARKNSPTDYFASAFDDDTLKQLNWDLDGDGQYDDATTPNPFPGSYQSENRPITLTSSHEIGVQAVDNGDRTSEQRMFVDAIDENLPPYGYIQLAGFRPHIVKDQPVQLYGYGYDTEESNGFGGGGGDVTYAWDVDGDGFDDGTTNTISPTFNTYGKKTVALKISDTDNLAGEDPASIIVRRELLVGSQPPTGSFTIGGTTVGGDGYDTAAKGTALTFTPTASDPDGTVQSIKWDWAEDGRGQFASASDPASHSFSQPGLYLVRMEVIDDTGEEFTAHKYVRITGTCDPCIDEYIEATPYSPTIGQSVTFTAFEYDSVNQTLTYEWDLDGNGTYETSTGTTPSKTTSYTTDGAHPVYLRVTDGSGNAAYAAGGINVTPESTPPVVYGYPSLYAPRVDQEITLTASAYDPNDDPITKFEWDVNGDGDFLDSVDKSGPSLSSIPVSFNTAGFHTVNVRVTADHGGTDEFGTDEITVNVHAGNLAPDVYAWADHAKTGVNQPIKFTASAYDYDGTIAGYEWDLDGDNDYSDDNVGGPTLKSYTLASGFSTLGTHTVHVRVTDNEGEKTVAAVDVNITSGDAAPTVYVYQWPDPAEAGKNVTFHAYANDPDGEDPGNYEWDLDGNGTYGDPADKSGASMSSVTFDAGPIGTRTIHVKVTDPHGHFTEVTRTFDVVDSPPTAAITGPSGLDKDESGTFTDATQGGSAPVTRQWAWDPDGDGAYTNLGTTGTQPATWTATGVFKLRLTVTDNNGQTDVAYHTVVVRKPSDVSIPVPIRRRRRATRSPSR